MAAWYRGHGYVVLDRNWRCRQGELDVIAQAGAVLVVCEVKTRTSDRFGEPYEAVTRQKQLRIRRLTARWLEASAPRVRPRDIRFDVASVRGGVVEVVEGAF